jgi:MoxR-like ATPase
MGDDSARQAGIQHGYDWAAWGRANATVNDGEHGATPAITAAMSANVPVWLWGGAGIGKSVGAAKFAEDNGFDYYELNLSGQAPSAITGRDRLKEFVQSAFTHAYRNGGVLNGEEIDNADHRVLTLINNAIANGHFWNPVTDEKIERHPDFRIVVTANTNGTGAGNGFIRNKIDRASIDRFAVGMFQLHRDPILEAFIIANLERTLLASIDGGDLTPLGF